MEKNYFASCNSYRGFKSYFGEIFNSREFERIFVLKGGPGTGKSTLMKKLAKCFSKEQVNIEKFFCSSDINSLDGVIIENGEKRVAILDGTAPHERDAIVVGAIDEIVNLAENLDYTWAETEREKILELYEQKSSAYKTAYSYLRCAGACDSEICEHDKNRFDFNTAKEYIANFHFNAKKSDHTKEKIRLISSFSKDGYQRENTLVDSASTVVKIGGDVYNSGLLLNYMNSNITGEKIKFPYPLNPDYLESLYSISDDTLFITGQTETIDINANDFAISRPIENEEIRVIKQTHDELLLEAKRWFAIASDIHFRLEEIYSRCMNFELNDNIFDRIREKISKVCDIQV